MKGQPYSILTGILFVGTIRVLARLKVITTHLTPGKDNLK